MIRLLVLLALLVVWAIVWAMGPWGVPLVLLLLFVPWVRRGLRSLLRWWVAGAFAVAVLIVALALALLPDGVLPIPPGAGWLTTPSYVGGPATAHPVQGVEVPANPHLARNGASNMHNDSWATDSYPWAGPLGKNPEVATAWFGIEECATLAFDSHDRMIALCGDLDGATLHVIEPDSMKKLATADLPDRPKVQGKKPWENLCAGAYFYLDEQDRAVVATTDRRILTFRTSDAGGQADLEQESSLDLSEAIPQHDCLIALLPDWQGRIWFETQDGLVGTVDPETSEVAVRDLGEEIYNSFAVGEFGGVYVVSTHAFYRFEAAADGSPKVVWRSTYDRGDTKKPGQLSQGSGTTPTVVDKRLIAITDNAEPRMNVNFYDRASGAEVCSAPVFGAGRSATENSLVTVDGGVIVENNYGYSGPQSTLLGRSTTPGIARVNIDGEDCSVAWTSDVTAPTSVPKASLATGLLYVYAKRPNWWGINAWYFTAVDIRDGNEVFAVRTGIGTMFNNHYAAMTLAPDGTAYIATLAGLVKIRDSP